MALRMKAKRTFAVNVPDGGDTVVWGITLPGKTMLNGFRTNLTYVCGDNAATNEFILSKSIPIAIETWLLPLHDPDTPTTYSAVFDRLVPKDTDAEIIDLDTSALVTSNFWEPGEMNLNMALMLGNQPLRLSHFHKIVTAANGSIQMVQDIEVPSNVSKFTPGGTLQVRSTRKVFVNRPSMLVMAVAVPLMDDVITTQEVPLTEQELGLVRYMRQSLEGAIMHQLGVAGAGGSSWFDTASAALLRHLNPDVFEMVAGFFAAAGDYAVIGETTIDHTVEGGVKIKMIAGGRG